MIKNLLFGPALLVGSMSSYATVPSYNNTFISYDSPEYVNSLLSYSSANNIGGLTMWETTGDLPATDKDSLLYQVAHSQVTNHPKFIELFWPDWSTERNYTSDGLPVWGTGGTEKYRDPLDGQKINDQIAAAEANGAQAVIAYSFVETNSDGSLQAYDPWADLQLSDSSWCSDTDNFCQGTPTSTTTSYGSIDNFLALKNTHPQLKTIIALGGWNHEKDVDRAIANYTKFIDSYGKLNAALKAAGKNTFDGISFDYESSNKDDLAAKFSGLVTLIEKFNKAYPDSYISVDLMGDDNFLSKIEPELEELSSITNLHFDIMAYDFHGAFDYGSTNQTGLLSRIYNNADSSDFSIQKEMTALSKINPQQISLGFAAYGRALSNITPVNNSLFEGTITAQSSIPIEYDLDDHGPNFVNGDNQPEFRCAVSFNSSEGYPLCDGMYPWSYIHDSMLGHGFTQQTVMSSNGEVSGIYATDTGTWTPSEPTNESEELKIDVPSYSYYNNSLTVKDDADSKTAGINNLHASTSYSVYFPATSDESYLSFDFLVPSGGSSQQCKFELPEKIDYSKTLTVTRAGDPYDGGETCSVTAN
ncbi:glycosyl hydrolase family 18 protein [Piscirickettsia litoralis]|uniref:chitinase n=1 Tax=Piscirickettsia litoralis TaxID=1891921 RepID=A0ABX2ZXB9_9GAMM|nr:glycoside hydrolase family 18 protein [Piscirickettsia litoralis]ODN41262.1 hypothetical protein BGC07_16960 [Piscirickettsia litoralis]